MNPSPHCLIPTSKESVLLLSGRVAQLPKATPRFRSWQHKIPFDCYGKKAVLDYHGKPMFAELLILRLLENAGWRGVWVDTYRRCFRTDVAQQVEIPNDKQQLLEGIYRIAGRRNGCFDVFVWKGEQVMFAESKRAGRDQIRSSQVRWIDSALQSGLREESLLVVEWSLEE